jgi:hypothetical protein
MNNSLKVKDVNSSIDNGYEKRAYDHKELFPHLDREQENKDII